MPVWRAITSGPGRRLPGASRRDDDGGEPYIAGALAAAPRSAAPPANAAGDWPSYNRTLTSERFADLSEINAGNVGRLKVVCTYDTGQHVSFESGLIMVNGALIGTTFADIFSIDPATCAENWRTREDLAPELLCQPGRRVHGRHAVSRRLRR